MYRLTIHQTGPGTVRVTHKATGITYDDLQFATQRDIVVHAKHSMRDLIYYHHGARWHAVEQHNLRSIKRSIRSAVRRMR